MSELEGRKTDTLPFLSVGSHIFLQTLNKKSVFIPLGPTAAPHTKQLLSVHQAGTWLCIPKGSTDLSSLDWLSRAGKQPLPLPESSSCWQLFPVLENKLQTIISSSGNCYRMEMQSAINHNIIILRPKWSGIFLLKMVNTEVVYLQWQIKYPILTSMHGGSLYLFRLFTTHFKLIKK